MNAQWSFSRDAITCFRFAGCDFDAATGTAQLRYAFDQGPELVERVVVPGAPFALDAPRAAAVQRALRLLHLVAGVSYYKAALPPRIVVDDGALDTDTAALLTRVYEQGLGEFAYRNGLSLQGRIRFPVAFAHGVPPSQPPPATQGEEPAARAPAAPKEEPAARAPAAPDEEPAARAPAARGEESAARAPAARGEEPACLPPPLAGEGWGGGRPAKALGLPTRALTAIGGGKDSLVSIEALRDAGVRQTVCWIGGSPLIAACAERTGLPTLAITRTLDPALFEYNRQGAWNGHVPVTAINSAVLVLAALLTGHDQVVFSNERSASYGSLIPGSGEVNHQWSKGWEFERLFGDHVQQRVAGDLHYFSLLRPLPELAVARRFARLDGYDQHFSSCNRNFHILGERPSSRWCGQCPKCLFVFLALAPFMPKPRLLAIFGRNLLDDAALADGFDALIEYRNHKPFECVGEARESRAALALLAARPEWREDRLVQRFARDILPQLGATPDGVPQAATLLVAEGPHRIPPSLLERLGEDFRPG